MHKRINRSGRRLFSFRDRVAGEGDDGDGRGRGALHDHLEERLQRGLHDGDEPADGLSSGEVGLRRDEGFGLYRDVVGQLQGQGVLGALGLGLHARAQHVDAAPNRTGTAGHLGDFGQAAPFGVHGTEALAKETHRRQVAVDGRQAVPDGDVAVQGEGERHDVPPQVRVQLEVVGEEVDERRAGAGLPGGPVLVGLEVQDELEELHQRALGAGRDRRGEDVLAPAGDAGHAGGGGGGGGLVNEEGADGQELDLAVGARRDQLGQQPRLGVDDARGQRQRVGPRGRQAGGGGVGGLPRRGVAEDAEAMRVRGGVGAGGGAGEILGLPQAEGSLMLAVEVVGVRVEDALLGPRECSSSRRGEAS